MVEIRGNDFKYNACEFLCALDRPNFFVSVDEFCAMVPGKECQPLPQGVIPNQDPDAMAYICDSQDDRMDDERGPDANSSEMDPNRSRLDGTIIGGVWNLMKAGGEMVGKVSGMVEEGEDSSSGSSAHAVEISPEEKKKAAAAEAHKKKQEEDKNKPPQPLRFLQVLKIDKGNPKKKIAPSALVKDIVYLGNTDLRQDLDPHRFADFCHKHCNPLPLTPQKKLDPIEEQKREDEFLEEYSPALREIGQTTQLKLEDFCPNPWTKRVWDSFIETKMMWMMMGVF